MLKNAFTSRNEAPEVRKKSRLASAQTTGRLCLASLATLPLIVLTVGYSDASSQKGHSPSATRVLPPKQKPVNAQSQLKRDRIRLASGFSEPEPNPSLTPGPSPSPSPEPSPSPSPTPAPGLTASTTTSFNPTTGAVVAATVSNGNGASVTATGRPDGRVEPTLGASVPLGNGATGSATTGPQGASGTVRVPLGPRGRGVTGEVTTGTGGTTGTVRVPLGPRGRGGAGSVTTGTGGTTVRAVIPVRGGTVTPSYTTGGSGGSGFGIGGTVRVGSIGGRPINLSGNAGRGGDRGRIGFSGSFRTRGES